MVRCEKCRGDNPLGRVFCGQCGAKLDLSRVSRGDIPRKKRSTGAGALFALILVVVLIAIAGLALWPSTAPLGKRGGRTGARRVENAAAALTHLGKGQSLGFVFLESDVNGYFDLLRVNRADLESLTCLLEPGRGTLRMVRNLGTIPVGSFVITPRLSFDLVCVSSGTRISVKRVWIGHLPLAGTLRLPVIAAVNRSLARAEARELFKYLVELKIEKGQVSLAVKK